MSLPDAVDDVYYSDDINSYDNIINEVLKNYPFSPY
jgi:hypothetical protein